MQATGFDDLFVSELIRDSSSDFVFINHLKFSQKISPFQSFNKDTAARIQSGEKEDLLYLIGYTRIKNNIE